MFGVKCSRFRVQNQMYEGTDDGVARAMRDARVGRTTHTEFLAVVDHLTV